MVDYFGAVGGSVEEEFYFALELQVWKGGFLSD